MYFDYSKEPGKILIQRELNTDGKPLVSIITAFYNAGKYFEQTYNCVMNQTFPYFEWIIINDGSTRKEDIQLIEKLAQTDARIILLHQENKGQSSARNFGIKKSSTDIIVPLDADDLIIPTYLEYVYFGLYFNLEASWCYTDSLGFQGQEYLWRKSFSTERMKKENILICTAAIRKVDLEEIGGYDEIEKHYDEDWRLWLKLLSKNKYPVHIGEYAFWYRKSISGMSRKVQEDSALRKKSWQLIQEVAGKVDTNITAKEYPCSNVFGKYQKPKLSNWERKVFKNNNKIKIMMLIPWMEMGGADLFNLDVVRKIDKNKFEISILTTVAGESTWKQQFEEYMTDIFELPNFLDIQNYAEFISYFIKSRDINIIFLSNSYYGYYLIPWLRKEFSHVAIVDYVHMEEWYWRNGGFARTSGVVAGITEKTYVCNERTRNVMINDFGRNPDSVKTVYIGVDKHRYDESKVELGIAKNKLGIASERPTVLFPCRVHPQKRPFLMFEIAKEIKNRISNIAFIVVGDGPQLNELETKTKSNDLCDTIYYAGRQNDMLPYYKDSDVTLICSLKEGLALTAYESLSMSTPVISSDVGGQRELIDDKVGMLLPLMQSEEKELDSRVFTEEEVKQYVDAIESILTDKTAYEEKCKECRLRIEQYFSNDIMIKKLEIEFNELINDDLSIISRVHTADDLLKYSGLVDDYSTLYTETESFEGQYKNTYAIDSRMELMRIANSKLGSRMVKLAFKLKLNKLIK